jgi:hypothetical protein
MDALGASSRVAVARTGRAPAGAPLVGYLGASVTAVVARGVGGACPPRIGLGHRHFILPVCDGAVLPARLVPPLAVEEISAPLPTPSVFVVVAISEISARLSAPVDCFVVAILGISSSELPRWDDLLRGALRGDGPLTHHERATTM